jgi:acetylornithine deacetylase/succinyl-diaminopimelate desuccinylase-like protein
MSIAIDTRALSKFIEPVWLDSIVPTLCEYVRIPNKSPLFDPEWERHGHMERAVQLLASWARRQPIKDMQVEIARLPGRTPVILIEIPGSTAETVLLYGHLDKQPEFTGWLPGLGPWEPVLRDGRLYGRGAADDGYALFASLTAIAALEARGLPHARCIVLIEACEESGSVDLPAHVEALAGRIGSPSLVVCLDAESGDYERLWLTTSLRGNIVGTLEIDLLTEGVHSGAGSGIAASCFDVLRQLLGRVANERGEILVEEFKVEVPAVRRREMAATAQLLGEAVAARMPFVKGAEPLSSDPAELLLNSTWRATLTVTGIDGLPAVANAGNVLVPRLAVKLSFRVPPSADARRASAALKRILERDPPWGAQVRFVTGADSAGWTAPPLEPWLQAAVNEASSACYGESCMAMGVGGTIPFMAMLGERFPKTQFLVTGVLGPHSNAHGPNEFLHIDYTKRLTAAVAHVLARHAQR